MIGLPLFPAFKIEISRACELPGPGIRIGDFGFRQPLTFALLSTVLTLTACAPKETRLVSKQSDALGIVLAEEAIRAAGPRKSIAIISPDASWGPVSTVEEIFKAACSKQGLTAVTATRANVGNPMQMRGLGLKSAEFFDVLQKFPDVGAIVSFAGAPLLKAEEIARPSANHPPVLVVATGMLGVLPGLPGDRAQLARLLEAKIIQIAIIDGFDPAAAPTAKTDAAHRLFAEHYRILRGPD